MLLANKFQFYFPNVRLLIFAGMFASLGFMGGIFLRPAEKPKDNPSIQQPPLRLGGYHLISPLLLCDLQFDQNSASLEPMRNEIQLYIDSQIDSGLLAGASVYFRFLNSGEEFHIQPDEKFFPASIKKLPLMIQYIKEAEKDPGLLTTKRKFQMDKNYNEGATISPKESPVPGADYTAAELLTYMIKYSDNNSFAVLYKSLGETKANQIYQDMKLQFPDTYSSLEDYITPYQTSLFFRILYNATYLNNENSETALQLLTQTDFNDGLVRDLPPNTTVAHKFGISTVTGKNNQNYGELHDCGIVYKGNNPYILCVMTKSRTTDLGLIENVIAKISALTYKNVP